MYLILIYANYFLSDEENEFDFARQKKKKFVKRILLSIKMLLTRTRAYY